MPKMFEYVQQLEHLKVKLEDIPGICDKYDSIKKFLLIVHNKDVNTKPHIHLMVNMGNTNKSFDEVCKWFNDEPQYFGYIKDKWARAALYLLHRGNTDKDKHQYEPDEIISNYDFMPDIEKAQKNEDNKLKYMDLQTYCEKVITGEIVPNSPEKYLSDFDCINDKGLIKKAYNERVRRMINERKQNRNNNVKVIFITGPGRSGKDFTAINFAQMVGDGSYCISSSDNDTMQDYSGENTLILSDLRDTSMSFNDLLKVLDNYLPSSIKSRYNNKYFIGEYIIITSAVDLYDWYKSNYNTGEDMNQLIGRINIYIKIDPDNNTVKQYNRIDRNTYERLYMMDDNTECINFFPVEYRHLNKNYFKCIDVQSYERLENQIRMKQALEDNNVINVLDCLGKEVKHLPDDIRKLKDVVINPDKYR